MPDVIEQLRAYGEGLEREALQRGRLVSATTRPRRPNEHRWWIGLAASLLLVTGVGGSMALRGHAKATETVMSNEPTVSPPVVVSSERPSWYDNALDHTGRVRGTVTGRMVALPGGLTGEEVVDQHGAVVGYMMGGKSALGFVDLDQAAGREVPPGARRLHDDLCHPSHRHPRLRPKAGGRRGPDGRRQDEPLNRACELQHRFLEAVGAVTAGPMAIARL